MTLTSGTPATGSYYTYTASSLPAGGHACYYEITASSLTKRFPESGFLEGPYVNASPAITYNIGSTNGGFTHSGTRDDWEWGIPTTGPSTVPVGTRVWATKLTSNYRDSSDSRLATPVMNLASYESAFLGFWHWYSFQSPNSAGYHDGGTVKISVSGAEPFVVYPQKGYDAQFSQYPFLNPYKPGFADSLIGNFWQYEVIDLSPWCGQSVQIFFDFGSSSLRNARGWYINNVHLLSSFSAGMGEPNTNKPDELLLSCFPNPFNESAGLLAEIPKASIATLSVYDINGNLIKTLFEGYLDQGKHYFGWHANGAPCGIYLVRLSLSDHSNKVIKLVLVK